MAFLKTLPLVTAPGKLPRRGQALRVNDRLAVQDAGWAERLWGEGGLGELLRGGGEGDEGDGGKECLW